MIESEQLNIQVEIKQIEGIVDLSRERRPRLYELYENKSKNKSENRILEK